jgi:hypothetical protein
MEKLYLISIFYKGKLSPRIPLSSKLSAQWAGYVLIDKDLRSVTTWLEKIDEYMKEQKEDVLSTDRVVKDMVKGLWIASLTFYGKCFTEADGRKIKLNLSQLNKEYHEDHNEYINLRNNFAAHAGSGYEKVNIVLVLPPIKKVPRPPLIVPELYQPFYSTGDFLNLVKHVQEKVLIKIKKLEKVGNG